jgi:hypothetical protein
MLLGLLWDWHAFGRRMVVTTNRRMALAPHSAKVGDQIWIIPGSETPHCLWRIAIDSSLDPMASGKKLKFVGKCYFHSNMEGEALENGTPSEEIALI